MNNVVCVKWGNLYGPEYVNNLYAMVKRNLTEPFRFICLTDKIQGLHKDVETKPLPGDKNLRGWWTKIAFFQSPLYDIEGPVLTMDLDVVIVDNIDCFFNYKPGSFVMKQDYGKVAWKEYGHSSCIMRFEAGKCGHIYNNLDLQKMDHVEHHTKSHGMKKHKYWGDQIWITEQMKGNKVELWPKEWIPKFAKDCHLDPKTKEPIGDRKGAGKLDYSRLEFKVPKNAKVLVFSGRKHRNENEMNKIGKWWHCNDLC